MKNSFSKGIILVFLAMFFLSASGQNTEVKREGTSDSLMTAFVLPPLDSLYAWALGNSAKVRQQEALMFKSDQDRKRVEKQWMNTLKFSANVRTGNYGNPVIIQVETGYSYGPMVSFSLYELLGQRNLVNVYKAEAMVADAKKDEAVFELKKWINILYNNTISQLNLLKIRNEAVITSETHLRLAEREFSTGEVSLGELARVTEIYTKALADRETTWNDLVNSYDQLQQYCGRKF